MPGCEHDAFEICFRALKDSCSGSVRAVALALRITVDGLDDDTGDMLRNSGAWRPLLDKIAAATNVGIGGNASARPCRRKLAPALQFALRLNLAAFVTTLPACAPVLGFPANPADDSALLTSLQPYFDPSYESRYSGLKDENPRRSLRDEIVINRLRAYELEFNRFEQRLWGDNNLVSTGGDLVALILAGLGATTGNSATKTALAAASAGVLGAQGAISKDLYYQRTLTALLSQMEANRDKIKLNILNGLSQTDAQYSLYHADLDLDTLQRASGLPDAIGGITEQAVDQKATAQANLAKAQFLAALVPAAVQDRKEAINSYVRGLVTSGTKDDLTKLDAIGAKLGVAKGSTPVEERNNILLEMDRLVGTPAEMDTLSAKLKSITQRDF